MKSWSDAARIAPFTPFAAWVSALRPTSTIAFGSLRLVRLVGLADGPDAELLEEALQSGRTTVSEVGSTGEVGWVRVCHRGTLPLLLLDGEQIVGAKQNRILNASFLVEPGQDVRVPVSCVERGRWRSHGLSFGSSGTTITATARAAKLRRLHSSLEQGHGHDCDQGAVWRDVDQYLARTQATSPSAAFADGFSHRRADAARGLASFKPEDGQVGIAAVWKGRLVGLDVFGSCSLYARGWATVARGMLADVYDEAPPPSEHDAHGVVQSALHLIAGMCLRQTAAPGIGHTVHATREGITLAGIAAGDVLYHAMAAPSVGEAVDE